MSNFIIDNKIITYERTAWFSLVTLLSVYIINGKRVTPLILASAPLITNPNHQMPTGQIGNVAITVKNLSSHTLFTIGSILGSASTAFMVGLFGERVDILKEGIKEISKKK